MTDLAYLIKLTKQYLKNFSLNFRYEYYSPFFPKLRSDLSYAIVPKDLYEHYFGHISRLINHQN